MTFFIFGAGYTGKAFSLTQSMPVYGTTRDIAHFKTLKAANIIPLLFDGVNLSTSIIIALKRTTHLIISIASTAVGDPVLGLPNLWSKMPILQWIGYLSTVGVYGNHNGRWVDETAPCYTTLPRNKKRIEIEKSWQRFSRQYNIPLAILRLAGIYGPGRNAFVKLRKGKAHRIIKPGQVFNRVHVADIAGAINHLADNKCSGIFNICDNEPAFPQDVITFAARLLRMQVPPEIPFEKADIPSVIRSFYSDNKRVSNKLLLKTGYRLNYPDYRKALTLIWQTRDW
ncbi:MAG: Nucleoside-diphosphate-sugar epimerase [Candidatus Tokpelaia sp. JSC188]|nr:MAG: Nucleoside-diphosphate-sugar epimerase [Candidatus Tokpelaia sp. JSC188]